MNSEDSENTFLDRVLAVLGQIKEEPGGQKKGVVVKGAGVIVWLWPIELRSVRKAEWGNNCVRCGFGQVD
jgi:hypothetical protein